MRKIISKEIEEKRAKRNRMILGFFLVFIMFFSVAEYAFLSGPDTQTNTETNSITYNGFKFTSQNGYWILNKDGTNFIFRYNPNQITPINTEINGVESYYNKPLYIKTNNINAESEIRTNIAVFAEGIIMTDKENCADNTIIIESKNESNIYQKENCVYIQGAESELVKLTDEFLFDILNIRS
ncbi:MAG: hypothetical protein AABX93_01470 [Nanoarchaeota archaeon]